MNIFIVFRVSDPVKMDAAIQTAFPNDHLEVTDGEWLVASAGNAQEVSDKLGVTPESNTGPAMIFSMSDYYGRAPANVWDWVKAKAEQSGG